ncbi:MAG: hypothetical protein ACPKM0_02905 [Pleomorphochaeta sp.]
MFYWDKKSIAWFENSATQSDFHKNIANEIRKFVKKDCSLLSLGSGLGFLERELSPYFKDMVLVDNNKFATDYLNQHKLCNQKVINLDSKDIEIKSDYLLLSFFSRMYINDDLDDYLNLTNKKIFYLVNERHTDLKELISYLISKGNTFSMKSFRINFDQILDKNEIEDFLNHYYSQEDENRKKELRNQFEELDDNRVIFKNKKKIILFIIFKGEIN